MQDLKNIFKKVETRNGSLFGLGTGVQADWKFIFFSTVLLIVIVSTLNVLVFLRVDKGEVFESGDDESGPRSTLNLDKLRDANTYYRAKALEFNRIKSGGARASFSDPSI